MKTASILQTFFIALITLALSGCGSTREFLDIDTIAKLKISASSELNPDRDGRPSPIVIKVFALSDDRQFKREDFLSLYENPAERLGSDLIESFELKEFSPEEKREEIIHLKPETRFIGIMAAYVQYDVAQALLILPITPHASNTHLIRAERLRIISTNN
ncbi:MAG: type VI secretion system lipoprotein TssJ [Spongiibacteraceae bacterium]